MLILHAGIEECKLFTAAAEILLICALDYNQEHMHDIS